MEQTNGSGEEVCKFDDVGMSAKSGREEESHKYAANLMSIMEAHVRISPHINKTAVVTSKTLDAQAGCNLFFKCELHQKGGAFKFRGACNAILSLSDDEAQRGVVTHSSGNHAAAVALAAQMRNIPAYIIVPNNAPACKIENVRRYGGRLTLCESTLDARQREAARVQKETGAVLIHPFNDSKIISGQGTVGVEFLEQVQDLDVIVVPISGGGLISGIALAAKSINPNVKIIGAEPVGADDSSQSKLAGYIIPMLHPNTIADGLRASLGDLTWPVVRDLVCDIVTVTDDEIITATKLCYEILKLVVEPSGAIGLAVVLSGKFKQLNFEKQNVGIVLSGGNMDLKYGEAWNQL